MTAAADSTQRTDAKPTIVLVHGAFADASGWNGVIERLQHQGYTVVAPANPLRGVGADSAYLAGVVNQLDGPALVQRAYPTGPGGETAPEFLVDPARCRHRRGRGLACDHGLATAGGSWPHRQGGSGRQSRRPGWRLLIGAGP